MKDLPIFIAALATVAGVIANVPRSDGLWHSGYIDPWGKFYGCAVVAHRKLAASLCQAMGYVGPDPMQTLDVLGWAKVSADGFFWNRTPTFEQKEAIRSFMLERGLSRARFNHPKMTRELREMDMGAW